MGETDRANVIAGEIADPPVAGFTPLAGDRETVPVQTSANERWRGMRKRIGSKQLQRSLVVLEQLDQQRDEPGMIQWRRHRGEPPQPIEPQMVESHLVRN